LEVGYNLNHIRQFQGIVLGRPGSGKTLVARWMADRLCEKYGARNVNAVSCSADLGTLLSGVRGTLVNFLFLDDLTLSDTKKADISRYFRIRHVIEEATGRKDGIVITLLGLHRFYGCDPSIRTNFDFLLFRSAPTNKFDKNFTEGYLGKTQIKLLSAMELDRMKKPALFNTTFAWLKGEGAGFIHTPAPEYNMLYDMTQSISNREPTKDELYRYLLWKQGYVDDPIDESVKYLK